MLIHLILRQIRRACIVVMPLIQMVELARGRAGQKPSGLQANVLTGPAEQKADIHGQPPGGEQGPASTQDAFIEGPNRSGRARPADCSAPAPARPARGCAAPRTQFPGSETNWVFGAKLL